MNKTKKESTKKDIFKNFRNEKIITFAAKYGSEIPKELNKTEKIKLCSSDDFNAVAASFSQKYKNKKSPIMISHVGGFYVMASLAGKASSVCNKNSKPKVLFFDRKTSNIKNALYNTILMQICDTKEEYLTTLFGMSDLDIIKALNPSLCVSFIESILESKLDYEGLSKKDKKELLKAEYEKDKENIDDIITKDYITDDIVDGVLSSGYNLNKIVKYLANKPYDSHKHYEILMAKAKDNLTSNMFDLFKTLSDNMTEYLSIGKNYRDLVKYLSTDIKLNNKYHILAHNSIYNGYKSLTSKNGTGVIKFVAGVDINTDKGIKKLETILENEGFINSEKNNSFPIDIAFIPHINILKNSYDLIKQNVEDYIMLNKSGSGKNSFSMSSTATLEKRDYKSISASFIEEERKNRIPLENLSEVDRYKGFPLISFIAGANYGNIYHSENDTNNMIDMAIADKVDTVYIQGLIYGTYYHHQTSRRLLNDPLYESLDSRLKAARAIIKRLNDAGIKVVYQMGDEEHHLYQDMFKIYVREQGVTGSNFLEREDLRSKYDWVRPIIIKELIPYLIRSGEDVTNFYTDEAQETKVSELCHALKLYKEGLPLGHLADSIKPEFLEDNDMFRVVYSTIDSYDDIDPALSVNLLSNPNFSHITQYGKPGAGVNKNLRLFQTNAASKYKLEEIPQLFVDSRQGFMSISYQGEQATISVPQMINDGYYIEHPELLSGIKEHILEDPTHKRVTQVQTRPNFPGGWTISGDERERMTILPYYRRVKEVMEHVQKTGEGLPTLSVLHQNDTQIGSPTERIKYYLKMLDYAFYEENIKGIWGNGDFQQGWNYPKFANESRHLGTMSVSQQMVDFVKLQRPWIQNAFGVIKKDAFVCQNEKYQITYDDSGKIMNHLRNNNLISGNSGIYNAVDCIKKEIDYKTVDLKLEGKLKEYEKTIREKLCEVKLLWFYHMVEGNHEMNTDWNNKGYKLIEHLRQELENYKQFTGSDIEIVLTEFFVNRQGDFVNAPYGSKTINGYNIVYGHQFKALGKGSGGSPTVAMANYFDQMADSSNRVDRAFMGHLHVFETSVVNNKLLSVTGSSAGQSGYEQCLGYSSCPLYVIDKYLADGRIELITIGTAFLDQYEIQNPEVKAIGLDNFIEQCLTEEVPIYGPDEPRQYNVPIQRKQAVKTLNKVIGPKIGY